MLSKKDLPEDTQQELRDILERESWELDDYQRAFLKSRILYLTEREKEQFGEVMEKPINRKKVMARISAEPVKKVEPKKKPFVPKIIK